MSRIIVLVFCVSLVGVAPALANNIIGIWQTPPDRKDLTSHIEIDRCGRSFCGTILRAFNPEGQEVMTKNIGKRLFWDVEDLGDGVYGEGEAFVPLINGRTKNFTLSLDGDVLTVTGRMGPIRSTGIWTRLR